jgi:hypothetical protein
MDVKLIPNEQMQDQLSQVTGGRRVKYIICEPTQMDILKQNGKRKENLKQIKTPVICLNNNIRYESIKSASIDLRLDPKAISKCINGKQETVKGYKFKKDT